LKNVRFLDGTINGILHRETILIVVVCVFSPEDTMNAHRLIVLSLGFLLCTALSNAQTNQPRVASYADTLDTYRLVVLSLSADGVSQTEMRQFASRLKAELGKVESLNVDTQPSEAQLAQYNDRFSPPCYSAECAVEAGEILGADLVATGTIVMIGETYVINLRLVSVDERRVVKRAVTRGKWTFEQIIGNVTPLVTAELIGLPQDKALMVESGVVFETEKTIDYDATMERIFTPRTIRNLVVGTLILYFVVSFLSSLDTLGG
jgi:hypothetical protein